MVVYGRDREAALVWHTVTTAWSPDGDRPVLIVSGPAGVGKRTLLQTVSEGPHHDGLVLSGQCQAPRNRRRNASHDCSRLRSGSTFPAFQTIVDELVHRLAQDRRRQRVQRTIHDEFSKGDLEFLKETFPVIANLLPLSLDTEPTESAPLPKDNVPLTLVPLVRDTVLSPVYSKAIHVIRRFLQTVATCVPLVIMVDQLHCSDAASLELCRQLGTGTNRTVSVSPVSLPPRLLLAVTYRDDCVLNEAVTAFLESFRDDENALHAGVSSTELHSACRIRLKCLTWDDLYAWTRSSTTLTCDWDDETTRSFVDAGMELSGGNPLYMTYLLRWLHQSGLEMMKHARHVDVLEELGRRIDTPRDIAKLWAFLLSQQESSVIDLMEIMSALVECGYPSVSTAMLNDALGESCQPSLSIAKEYGFAVASRTEVDVQGIEFVQFPWIELQQAIYSMIPVTTAAMLHTSIARTIWSNGVMDQSYGIDVTTKIIHLARHFQCGATVLTSADDRHVVAQVSLRAAHLSTRTSFSEAAMFVQLGIDMLDSGLWSPERYELTLALHNLGAEVYYCSGKLDDMQRLLDVILQKAHSFRDKLQAYTTLVYANSSRNRFAEAVDTARDVLQQLGEPLALKAGKFSVLASYLRMRWTLRGKSDRFFVNLPQATDIEKTAAMQMICVAFMSLQSVNENCAVVAMFCMLRLALKHGMTGPAIASISGYGYILSSMSKYDEGLRYGKLAVDLLDQYEAREWLPRVYLGVYGYINNFFYPACQSHEPLLLAQQLALKSGDMESWSIACTFYLISSFHTGKHLAELQDVANSYCQMMTTFGQTTRLLVSLVMATLFANCTGEPGGLSGDLETVGKRAHKSALAQYYTNCTVFCCFIGDFAGALEMVKCRSKVDVVSDYIFTFFEGITLFGVARTAGWSLRRRYLARGRQIVKQMASWSMTCPANFSNKLYYFQAELAAIKGEHIQALALYDQSIEAALKYGMVQEAAMACQRAGGYQSDSGNQAKAVHYLQQARDLYRGWGAEVLANRMDEALLSLQQG